MPDTISEPKADSRGSKISPPIPRPNIIRRFLEHTCAVPGLHSHGPPKSHGPHAPSIAGPPTDAVPDADICADGNRSPNPHSNLKADGFADTRQLGPDSGSDPEAYPQDHQGDACPVPRADTQADSNRGTNFPPFELSDTGADLQADQGSDPETNGSCHHVRANRITDDGADIQADHRPKPRPDAFTNHGTNAVTVSLTNHEEANVCAISEPHPRADAEADYWTD